jgi:hypothetical protein
MKFNTNTILSYFIKDIKDPKELAFYNSIETNINLTIFYKDEPLYEISSNNYIFNYTTNISKYFNSYCNYKLYSYKNRECKYLYYKNDKKLLIYNYNYIWYSYNQNKYFKKISISYISNNKYLLNIKLLYHKGSKYIFRSIVNIHKFSQSLILIMNKYEFHYYNRFFNLYFDRLDYES